MKNNIIFDLDGTLTDSGPGIKNSVRHTLIHYGLPMEDDVSLNRYVGPPLLVSFQQYMGFSKERAKEAIAVYRSYFIAKGMFENRVYEGVVPMLTALKDQGKRLFIATGKPTVYTLQILEHFDLLGYFDQVCGIGLDEGDMGKDELINQILTAQALPPEDCVMVGDRQYDIIGAKAVGVPAVGVTYGYGTYEELKTAGADAIVSSVSALHQILSENQSRR